MWSNYLQIEMGGIGSVVRIADKISRDKAVRCSCSRIWMCSWDHPATPSSWRSCGFSGMTLQLLGHTRASSHLPVHMASLCHSFSNYYRLLVDIWMCFKWSVSRLAAIVRTQQVWFWIWFRLWSPASHHSPNEYVSDYYLLDEWMTSFLLSS